MPSSSSEADAPNPTPTPDDQRVCRRRAWQNTTPAPPSRNSARARRRRWRSVPVYTSTAMQVPTDAEARSRSSPQARTLGIADGPVRPMLVPLTEGREAASTKGVTAASTPAPPLQASTSRVPGRATRGCFHPRPAIKFALDAGKGLPLRARERRKRKRWIDGRSGDEAATCKPAHELAIGASRRVLRTATPSETAC